MDNIRNFIKYLLWRDMGNLGEGCLVSIVIWVAIIFIILFVIGLI